MECLNKRVLQNYRIEFLKCKLGLRINNKRLFSNGSEYF